MYKVAILGCENSHANSFLKLIQQGEYPDFDVIGVYSEDIAAAEKLKDTFGVPVMENFDSLVGQVDGIMVTARHGDNHYKYAKPYLDSGIPMFIDKPITCTDADSIAFMQEAKAKGVRLCGGSTCAHLDETLELAEMVRQNTCGELRGGSIVCPYYANSPYGGFHFYAQHLVDVVLSIFGTEAVRIRAEKTDGALSMTVQYPSFHVQGTYVNSANYYSVSVYGAKSVCTKELTFGVTSFRHEMDDMLHLLQGGEMKMSYDRFVLPVFIINTIERALASEQWEAIPEIII